MLDFVTILEKHVSYVLISGYVAILFGRTRTTEDVDFFISSMSQKEFDVLYADLLQHGFWALNTDDAVE